MMQPTGLTHAELEEVLTSMLEHVKARDSFGGFVEYDALEEMPPGKDFLVRATWRVGNSMGQGGMRIVGDIMDDCPAVFYHGPGHQSVTHCERRDPHDLEGAHNAANPMEPGFEWTGAKGFS